MKNKSFFIVLLLVFTTALSSQEKGKKYSLSAKEKKRVLKTLKPEFKKWYNMVAYIASKEERKVFLILKNDKERGLFIKAFWNQRDPTPGTDENEYKNEIEARWKYVNRRLQTGSPRPGWMTDMGRFYMILGKPNSIDSFENSFQLYPTTVWYYYGDIKLRMPTYFCITFYRPNFTTEWKHYNPSFQGPSVLFVKHEPVDNLNFEELYDKIKQLEPALLQPAFKVVPGDPYNSGAIMTRNNIVLANIIKSPLRRINSNYASDFLKYKGYVDIDSSINYIENSHSVSITRYNRFNFNFINFSIKPNRISIGYSEEKEKYFFNFELSVNLKKGEEFIYQYTKNYEFYVDPDKVKSFQGKGVIIHDSFPAIPGKYTLSVFAKNTIGDEFTYFEKKLDIPISGSVTRLSTPVIGYKTEIQLDQFFSPYKINNKRLSVDTKNIFRLKEKPIVLIGVFNLSKKLWENGKVEVNIKNISERKKFSKDYKLKLNDYPYRKNLNILHQIEELNTDYYELNINIIGKSGIILDTKSAGFTISPVRTFSYPMETFKKSNLDNPYYFYNALAIQYESIGNLDAAEINFKTCVKNKPDYYQGHVSLLNILNKRKKYNETIVEVEKLKDVRDFALDYHLIKGTAFFGLKDYEKALDQLLGANKINDSDTRVLNMLGFALLKLNNIEEAKRALKASLLLNDKQSFISKTLEKLNK